MGERADGYAGPDTPERILAVLDAAAARFVFPVLDNGYVYPAASRLTAFSGRGHWALVIELFGFSPRAGLPDTHVYTFADSLHDRNAPEQYVSDEAYRAYLSNNPHNESRFLYPLAEGDWQDSDDPEYVSPGCIAVSLRGHEVAVPRPDEFPAYGVVLEAAPRVQVFELCRVLAALHRPLVLATPAERRASAPPELPEVLVLDEWHHPDVSSGELPSATESFQQLALVLATGDTTRYRPSTAPNTHWRNWPEAGTL